MSVLELDGVSKSFSTGSLALDDVSLSLGPGDFVGVFGDRRCGKTTLLRVAAGLDGPDAGTVRFDGQELGRLSRREHARLRREEIGCVWQSMPLPFNIPVLEIAALPVLESLGSRRARLRARTALRAAGAADCATAIAHELSDGDRARVALALGLVREPALLLADEPTAYLNQAEREDVLAILTRTARERGTAILMAAADAPSTQRSQRIISMDRGRLVEPRRSERGQLLHLRGSEPRATGQGA